jgi:hypothetical protein
MIERFVLLRKWKFLKNANKYRSKDMTAHQLAKILLQHPDLPVVLDTHAFDIEVEKVEVGNYWKRTWEDGEAGEIRKHGIILNSARNRNYDNPYNY